MDRPRAPAGNGKQGPAARLRPQRFSCDYPPMKGLRSARCFIVSIRTEQREMQNFPVRVIAGSHRPFQNSGSIIAPETAFVNPAQSAQPIETGMGINFHALIVAMYFTLFFPAFSRPPAICPAVLEALLVSMPRSQKSTGRRDRGSGRPGGRMLRRSRPRAEGRSRGKSHRYLASNAKQGGKRTLSALFSIHPHACAAARQPAPH